MKKILLLISTLCTSLCLLAQDFSKDSTVVYIPEVTVTGTRVQTSVRELSHSITIIKNNQLNKTHQTSMLKSIEHYVPSLMLTQRGMLGFGVSGGAAGGMMLRGISSGAGQVMVLIDGHPQYQGIYGHSIGDSYQNFYTQKVEVLSGPASVLYGSNAMGGVINIVTQNADSLSTMIDFQAGSYGTVAATVSHKDQGKKFGYEVGGEYLRSDNHRPNMGFEQYGGYLKANYNINNQWKIWADFNFIRSNSSNPGSEMAPMEEADQWINRGFATIALENNLSFTQGRISLYSNFGRHKINDGYQIGAGSPQTRLFRSKDALSGISAYQTMHLSNSTALTLGFDYQNIYGNAYYTSRETNEILETPNKQSAHVHNDDLAGYLVLSQRIIKKLTFDGGIRIDNHTVTGNEIIPQVGLVFRPTATIDLKAKVSKGFRNPTMKEMYLYPPSNLELSPEKLINYEVSYSHWIPSTNLRYSINLFMIDADNIIQTINKKNVNTGELKNKGIELMLSYIVNKNFVISTNHSYLDMETEVLSAPKYKGVLMLDYQFDKWNFDLNFMQVCDMKIAQDKYEDFSLLGLTVDYKLNKKITFYVNGDNLLAQKYCYIEGFPMPKATFMAGAKFKLL